MVALYQILVFIIHNGRRRTPLHILNAEAIHNTCRSRTLISSLNHFGLSISYDELLRYHNDMAAYVLESSDTKVPLPSHFDPESETMGAMDNFDHEEATLSGIGGSHDTVSILMQDNPKSTHGKPNISQTNVDHGATQFKQELPCQTLQDYIKPAKKTILPENYKVAEDLYKMDPSQHELIEKKDMAWVHSRLDLSELEEGVKEICEEQNMPSWNAFNSLITDEQLQQKIIGFLPVIPHPVTEYTTVYTTLKNF